MGNDSIGETDGWKGDNWGRIGGVWVFGFLGSIFWEELGGRSVKEKLAKCCIFGTGPYVQPHQSKAILPLLSSSNNHPCCLLKT